MTTGTAYHLVGIGGSGMSAIARLLLRRGLRVSGSDLHATPLVRELESEGAVVAIGHRPENVGAAGILVVSSAIARDNPEYGEAERRGMPIVTRGEMLARIIGTMPTVAIAGTHGKTTTTAMVAAIFEGAGYDPTVALGGQRVDSASNARAGNGDWFITESDESDGSFLRLSPTIAVVTNIENDHIASDADLPLLVEQFVTFLEKLAASGAAVIGVDNRTSAGLVRRIAAPVTTFATRAQADLRADDVRYVALGSEFTLLERGCERGRVALHVPGEINVKNALAAAGAALAAGIPFDAIVQALASFRGVRRRFEVVGRSAGLTVVDDYAHHPTAIAETIAAARHMTNGPVVVAFQPHRYTRTAYLAADFARALAAADWVYLTPVYAAAEPPIAGISERSIGEPLSAAGTPVIYVDDVTTLATRIPHEAPHGALVLMLGAGSISSIAHQLGAAIAEAPVAAT
ncbi:MAG: UDP-N-acetylmuramate--L-alanine ligase [Candidatus Velthaea sp.]